MTTPPPGNAPVTPAWKPLDAAQRRVLGVLIEKAKTTPAGYPMTVNSIVVGCNQKNNRDPLTSLDDFDVEKALDELGTLKVVSEIDWMGRVPKYKHNAYEWFGVSRVELAVLAELLLRGAQALGDLRARAARMEPIADLAALKPIVDGLVSRGLMLELTAPGRGQIVSHNVYLAPERAELERQHAGHVPRAARLEREADAVLHAAAASPEALAELTSEIAALRAEVAILRERVAALESQREGPAS